MTLLTAIGYSAGSAEIDVAGRSLRRGCHGGRGQKYQRDHVVRSSRAECERVWFVSLERLRQ